LIALLNQYGVVYLVVGGFAVAHHGYPRFTGDIATSGRFADLDGGALATPVASSSSPQNPFRASRVMRIPYFGRRVIKGSVWTL
jgi:hypothetical protein